MGLLEQFSFDLVWNKGQICEYTIRFFIASFIFLAKVLANRIIAKVLANRLREVMDNLISPLQSAFIPGRQMIDNIVMAEEIVAAWRRFGTAGFLWKVDFAKAYDSIDWRYFWNVLRRRGFSEEWVRWMKLCVTTSSCSVLINGWM